jgi:integrase/recombinase XerC
LGKLRDVRMARDKRGIWYVWFDRTRCRSLRTRDKDEAKVLYNETRRKWLRGKLQLLEHGQRMTLATFRVEYLKIREGKPDATYRADDLALRKLEEYAATVPGGIPDLRRIDPKFLSGWVACLRTAPRKTAGGEPLPPLRGTSINAYLRHVRSALGVAREWELIEKVPKFTLETEEISVPRLVDVGAAIAAIEDPYIRRYVIALAGTGCRRSELHRATWGDICGNLLRVKGKRGKERLVPLLPIVREALGAPADPENPEERIFPKWQHADTVSHKIKEAVGAPPHHLRHSAASMLVMGGADLDAVRRIMGHTDLKTTQRYLHTTEAHLMEAMKRLQEARRWQGVVVAIEERRDPSNSS